MMTVFEVQEPIVYNRTKRRWSLLADIDEEVGIDDIELGYFEGYSCHMDRGEFIVVQPADEEDAYHMHITGQTGALYTFFTPYFPNTREHTAAEECIFLEADISDEIFFDDILPGLAVYETYSTRPKDTWVSLEL